MARTSLAAAKAELFALLAAVDGTPLVSGVAAAYDHDPGPRKMQGPISLLVATAGIEPDFWVLAVRLYADIGADPAGVQASLDTIMPAVTALVTARFGPERWLGPVPHPDREDWRICEWLVECGREDD